MDCQRAADLMMKYFDEECNEVEKGELYLHLAECGPCNIEFQWLEQTLFEVENLEDLKAPENFEEEILQKIDLTLYRQKQNTPTEKGWIVVVALFAALSAFVYCRYGTVDWKAGYGTIISLMKLVDWGSQFYVLVDVMGEALGHILYKLIEVLSSMTAFLRSRMGIYLLIVSSLCSIFIFIQFVLIKLTGRYGYREGGLHEE